MEIKKIAHLTGHSGAIYCLAHYKNGRFFSAGFDNMVVEWDIENTSEAKAIAKLNSKAISLLYLADKDWLVAGQSTGGVHIIDLKTRKEIHLLQAHEDMVFALCYVKEEHCLFVGGADGKISKWDLTTMQATKLVDLNYGKIREIKCKDNLLYVGCEDGSVVLISLALNECLKIAEHMPNFSVNTILVDGDRILTGSRDGHLNSVAVADLNYEVNEKIPAHNYAIYKIIKSPNGKVVATGSRDKSIKFWDAKTLKFIEKIDFKSHKGHIASVNDIIWFDDYLISVSDDRSVIVWKIKEKRN